MGFAIFSPKVILRVESVKEVSVESKLQFRFTACMTSLIFQQLFESQSSTYTYILADRKTREAVIIDPVLETVDRDLKLLKELELKLVYTLDTHIHADHVTGAGKIAAATGAKIAMSAAADANGVDVQLKDGQKIQFGSHEITTIATPGHTNSCMCYYIGDRIFTGDTLMIRANGRTDFQEGSAEALYKNVTTKLFVLPDETLVYPAHDYKGFTSSTIGDEKRHNSRLNQRIDQQAFVKIMSELKLPEPKQIKVAVPANLNCGRI